MRLKGARKRCSRGSDGSGVGQVVRGEASDPRPASTQVHDHEEGEIIGDGRDGPRQRDPPVGDLEEFRHDEGGDTHDRGH